jgi:hypothetical protein
MQFLIPTSPPPSFNFEEAIESIERLRGFSPMRLLTPHFGLLDNASENLVKNANALFDWKRRLEQLVSTKSSPNEIVSTLTENIAQQAGQQSADLPEFLRATIRISVLGFLGYLEWQSKH